MRAIAGRLEQRGQFAQLVELLEYALVAVREIGDRLVELDRGDATVIDTVTYSGLVPGTRYVASGELLIRPGGAATARGSGRAPGT